MGGHAKSKRPHFLGDVKLSAGNAYIHDDCNDENHDVLIGFNKNETDQDFDDHGGALEGFVQNYRLERSGSSSQ